MSYSAFEQSSIFEVVSQNRFEEVQIGNRFRIFQNTANYSKRRKLVSGKATSFRRRWKEKVNYDYRRGFLGAGFALVAAGVAVGVAHGHAARVHGHDLVVEAGEPALVLGNQLRLERALAIARNGNRQRAVVGQHGFAARVRSADQQGALGDEPVRDPRTSSQPDTDVALLSAMIHTIIEEEIVTEEVVTVTEPAVSRRTLFAIAGGTAAVAAAASLPSAGVTSCGGGVGYVNDTRSSDTSTAAPLGLDADLAAQGDGVDLGPGGLRDPQLELEGGDGRVAVGLGVSVGTAVAVCVAVGGSVMTAALSRASRCDQVRDFRIGSPEIRFGAAFSHQGLLAVADGSPRPYRR